MIEIYVMSKVHFVNVLEDNNINDTTVENHKNAAFISINDTKGDFYKKPLFERNHFNVLTMHFDDVGKDNEPSPTNLSNETKAFTEEQAKQVLQFLSKNSHVDTLMAHCAAGISRSGAVGQFALDYLQGDKEHFKVHNSHIVPNGRILRMLNNNAR